MHNLQKVIPQQNGAYINTIKHKNSDLDQFFFFLIQPISVFQCFFAKKKPITNNINHMTDNVYVTTLLGNTKKKQLN